MIHYTTSTQQFLLDSPGAATYSSSASMDQLMPHKGCAEIAIGFQARE